MTYEAESLLKPSYKKFKNRIYSIDELNELNKFNQSKKFFIDESKLINKNTFQSELISHEIGENSGFYYIPNPFKSNILVELIIDAICSWPTTKNRMNVDIEDDRPDDIWKESLKELQSGKTLPQSWLYKLRWTSMGYHYQWTDRIYRKECYSDIPENLSSVMKDIIAILGWKEFIPEAAIINYYHLNSAMCFHQDHAELAKDVPLVSMSLGQPAVYLLGTSDPRSVPIPITLYHGDIVVMSGSSRLAYHAVPKVVKMSPEMLAEKLFSSNVTDAMSHLTTILGCPTLAEIVWEYLTCSRINVNMRQVLNEGQDFPE